MTRDIPQLDSIEKAIYDLQTEQLLHAQALDSHNERLYKLEGEELDPGPDPGPTPGPVKKLHRIFMNMFHYTKTPYAVQWIDGKWVFDPLMLEALKPYGGIRVMDWQEIVDNPVVSWNDRPQVGDNFLKKGVPLEALVELANTLDCHLWACIPTRRDETWLEGFSNLIKTKLKNTLCIEESNETFHRNQWEKSQAGDWPHWWNFHVDRMLYSFDFLKQRLGAKVVTVFSGQHSNIGLTSSNGLNKMGNSDLSLIDAISSAPYSGITNAVVEKLHNGSMPMDEALVREIFETQIGKDLTICSQWNTLASKFNVAYLVYEYNNSLASYSPETAANSQLVAFLKEMAQRNWCIDGQIYFMKHWFEYSNAITLCRYAAAGELDNWGNWPDFYSDWFPRPIAATYQQEFSK